MACMGQGHQPQEAHAPRDQERKSPKGGRHLLGALGRRDSSPWPHPPGRLDLLGPAPPLALLYIVGRWRTSYLCLWCLPLPLQHILLLHRAWRSPAGVLQLHHHHAVVLLLEPSSSTSPSPCWIKKEETSLLRTCVERGGAVRSALGSSVIWITTSTTPSTLFS